MIVKDFLSEYKTHDARIYNIKYNPVTRTVTFKLENIKNEASGKNDDLTLIKLDVKFEYTENFNMCQIYSVKPKKKLEDIDEFISGIYFNSGVVEILVDEWDPKTHVHGETVIKFNAKTVDVTEIE